MGSEDKFVDDDDVHCRLLKKSFLTWTKAHGSSRLTWQMHTCRWKSLRTQRNWGLSTYRGCTSTSTLWSQVRNRYFSRGYGWHARRVERLCSVSGRHHRDWCNTGVVKSKCPRLFKRITECGIRIRMEKCSFAKKEIKFLGNLISKDGRRPDPEKIHAIVEMRHPRTRSN